MRARAIFIFGLTLMIAAAALEHHSEQRAFGASTRAVKMGKIKQELIKNQGDHPPDVHKFFLIDTVLTSAILCSSFRLGVSRAARRHE
ncbi:MAG TPA: hypothetical protein VMA09_22510 [Candidatus Binataceae bacterium]|nr:hypothetical protein [Candidatus Binataceae bacterium]